MSEADKPDPDRPSQPPKSKRGWLRRTFFTFFTDRGKTGETGTPDGGAYKRMVDATQGVAEVGQEAQAAQAQVTAELQAATIPYSVYAAALKRVEELEAQVAAFQTRAAAAHSSPPAPSAVQVQALLQEIAARLKQSADAEAILREVSPPPDPADWERWAALRERLSVLLRQAREWAGLLVGTALAEKWSATNVWPPLPLDELSASPRPALGVGHGVQADGVPKLEMVYVPAGWFRMGRSEEYRLLPYGQDSPQHWVWLGAYWIGKYPVTNAEYAAFVRATNHRLPAYWEDGYIPQGMEQHPVVTLTWHDARAFCAWLAAVSRRHYRLPSEAEWEKAARGTDGRLFPWGNEAPTKELGNYSWNWDTDDTTPVGSYPKGASPYGALDMAGKVWEWTSSLYKPYPYDASDGRESPEGNGIRVLRGKVLPKCAISYRASIDLDHDHDHDINDINGFRVAVSASP